jgi:hypothetical protein
VRRITVLDRRYCPVCHDESDVELLRCLDGHGDDCAERVCTACGTAIFAGVLPVRRPAAA